MDRPAPGLRLEAIAPPRQEIMRIWRTLRPVDQAFIQGIIGDVVMLTETPVGWIFLRTAAEHWDPEHAVFNFQGTELAPMIEEYTALVQRPTSTIHDIFVPNPFTTVQGQLSTLLYIPAQDIHEELHERFGFSPISTPFVHHIRSPFSYIADERSLIERLVPVIPPPEHSFSEWRRFWRELTLARFLWVARWNPGGPMITGYSGIVGVPLLSHLGSTLIFPGRVIRQLDGLQDVPAEADHLPFRIQWANSTSTAPARFLQIREIRRQWDACVIQHLYFPEHPTDNERVFAATSAYVARFYARGLASPQPMAEGDHVDVSEEVNPSVSTLSQPPQTHAPPLLTPAGVLPAYSAAFPTHLPPPASSGTPLPPASPIFAATNDQARIAALEGTVNQMATNMAELLALLRGPNRASSSSTPPPGPGPTVDPTPEAPPAQALGNIEIPAPPTLHTSAAGKKLDLGIKLGRMEDPISKGDESSKKVPATSSSSSGRRGKEATVNTVNTAQQANPLPDHGPAPGPSINMITICTSGKGEGEQGCSSPFVIEYIPAEAAVGFTGIDAPPAPLVIDILDREPYSDDKVPWTYEGGVGSLEQQFGIMGITRSGRLYENPTTTGKGKASATEEETRPRTLPTPSKKMAKSPAHISLLALLLNSEPHREALMRNHIDILVDNTALYAQFSFIDSFSGYNQIRMAEEDKIKTTFTTMWGTFCYRVMPFGLKNAGATYQRAMVTLFHDMMQKEVEVYVDDMIAKSKEREDHLVNLKRLFYRLKEYKLRLNRAKCTFGARSGKLLGFVVSERDKCQPLFRLIRKNAAIEWDEECQKAFDTIKAYLVQPPVLVPPTPGRPLVLYLMVRRQSLGCMLGQEEESTHTERAIYYLSKKFTAGESNYPEIEKMCCALVWVMQRLRQYTLYHTVRLLSKPDPLKYLLDSPSSTRNLAKWRCQLTEYDIEYVSRTSVKGQVIADHLAEFPIEDHTPINPDFPDEGILQVDDEGEKSGWKMYFDGAVNSTGSGIGAVLISPDGHNYPVAAKIDFPCTNNVAEYEACILGLQAAIDFQ
ncbi:hypothetical protein CRG98_006487, partial [Punica granatum]